MESYRLDNYKEFAKYMEYPMVVFSATTGEVIECNYGAQTILGQNVQKLIMMSDKFMDKEDFWEQLHSKKSIIWHRILLIADNNRHVVSGLINEFSIENDTIYVVMFELRTDLNIGSVTLERIINNVTDIPLLGSAIYSRWRYFNHWAYDGSEILNPQNRAWFISALSRLAMLSDENLSYSKEH